MQSPSLTGTRPLEPAIGSDAYCGGIRYVIEEAVLDPTGDILLALRRPRGRTVYLGRWLGSHPLYGERRAQTLGVHLGRVA